MKNENKHSTHPNNKSDFKWKLGIVLLGLWVIAVATVWYGYYNNGTTENQKNPSSICPISNNKNNNTTQWWGCAMMGNKNPIQNTSARTQPSVQEQTSPIIPTDSKAELITMNYNESWLEPSVVNVQVGKSYTISINANTDVYWCMSTIDIPWLDENMQSIRKWKTIIFNIKPTTAGEYEFLCAMWRSHNAKIVVQ